MTDADRQAWISFIGFILALTAIEILWGWVVAMLVCGVFFIVWPVVKRITS